MNILIPTRFGLIALRSSINDIFDTIDDASLTINLYFRFVNFNSLDKSAQEKWIQKISDDIETFVESQSQVIEYYINQEFLIEEDWLERAYQFKFGEDFPLDEFKNSFELKGIKLIYTQEGLIEICPRFYMDEKFTYGFHLSIENFLDIEQTLAPFIYFDSDFNYEACLKILSSENEPTLSLNAIFWLSFMEGCIHQGTLYDSSAYITNELIECVSVCHQEVKFEVFRLLYNLQVAYLSVVENVKLDEIENNDKRIDSEQQLEYGRNVYTVLLNNKDKFEKWQSDEILKNIITAILDKM